MKGGIPDEFFDNIEHVIWGNVGTTPHKRLNVCDFRNLTPSQINKLYHQSAGKRQHDSLYIMYAAIIQTLI
jgi:hypothetical protein